MRNEDRFLFLITRQNISPDQRRTIISFIERHPLDWQVVFDIAECNGVAPLIFTNLNEDETLLKSIPAQVINQFRIYTFNQMRYLESRSRQLIHALKYFHKKNIRVILIKGAALGMEVYFQPWYTVSNDMDLILSVKECNLSKAEIDEIGSEFYKKRIEFDFFQHHDMNMNNLLPIDFDEIWKEAIPVNMDGIDALVLSPENMLLSICVNCCRKKFLHLKSILDIAEVITKFSEINWGKFIDKCRRFQCSNIVYTAILVTKFTLGCEVHENVLRSLRPSPFRSILIGLILATLLTFGNLSSRKPKIKIFGRPFDSNLLLTYASYNPTQLIQKIKKFS